MVRYLLLVCFGGLFWNYPVFAQEGNVDPACFRDDVQEIVKVMKGCPREEKGRVKPQTNKVQKTAGSLETLMDSVVTIIKNGSPPPYNTYSKGSFLKTLTKDKNYVLLIPHSHNSRSEMRVHDLKKRLIQSLRVLRRSKLYSGLKVTLEVHTDNFPPSEKSEDRYCSSFVSNKAVAECRAIYIRALIKKHGYGDIRVVAVGDKEATCYRGCNGEKVNFERQLRLVIETRKHNS